MKKIKNLYKNLYFNFLCFFLLGVISSFSLPPYNYFILNFISLSVFFFLIVKKKNFLKKKDYFKCGYFFGFGYFLFSLYWISISLSFDNDFKIFIPVVLILIPALLSIFYGLATYIFSFFIELKNKSLILIFSVIFGVIEFIRGIIFTGFPWNLFAFSFSENIEFIQILSIFGTYGFNMICISIFLLPGYFILNKAKKEYFVGIFFLIIFISSWIFGYNELNKGNKNLIKKDTYLIKIVSPKISIDRFYDNNEEEKIIEDLINLSNPDIDIPTIFIWPEGVLTSTYLKDLKDYHQLFLKSFSVKHLIVLGVNDLKFKNQNAKVYNSLVVINKNLDVQAKYYKNNLVPFGEFLPLSSFFKKLGLRSITNGYQSFISGKSRKVLDVENDIFSLSFLPLICYEIIYSGKLSQDRDFDLIINISEDGWFRKSIGIEQHFSHSIFRAIEEGKNIARSTNNGISAFIDSHGVLQQKKESTQGSVIEIKKYYIGKTTLFSRYGNKMFFYLLIFYISFIFYINMKKD